MDLFTVSSQLSSMYFNYFKPYSSPPSVFLTAIHLSPSLKNKHDAASVWAEDVTVYNFKACLRELKNFDGEHEYVKVVSVDYKILGHHPRSHANGNAKTEKKGSYEKRLKILIASL